MAKKKTKKQSNSAEFANEVNASDVTWQLFEKTNDINYYRLYSAIKEENKKK